MANPPLPNQDPLQPPVSGGQVPVSAPTPSPTNSTPPPATASPSVQLSVPATNSQPEDTQSSIDKELESLSPFTIMQKRKPVTQAPPPAPAPAPVQSPAPPSPAPIQSQPVPVQQSGLTREELIKQAATASSDPFILPTGVPQPATPAPAPSPSPAPQVVAASLPTQTIPSRPPMPPAPIPQAPRPTPPVPAAPVAALSIEKKEALTPPQMAQPEKKSGGSKVVLAGAGLLVALALLGGGGYVMASGGSRIPVLYTFATGLKTDGLGVAKDALAFVAAQNSYQQAGSTRISLQEASDSLGGTSTPLTLIASQATAAEPLHYRSSNKATTGRLGITFNANPEIPVYFTTTSDVLEEGEWLFNLPANTVDPMVAAKGEDVKKSLLYPALVPLSLTDILSSLTKETAYEKVEGRSIAHYTYEIDSEALKSSLPEGAKLQSAKADVYYTFKTSEPIKVVVKGVLTYAETDYDFTHEYSYGSWGKALETGANEDLDKVINSDLTQGELAASSFNAFVPQLGIDYSSLPVTLEPGTVSPSEEAVVPSGESITAIGAKITSPPPAPQAVVSLEAQRRDQQRLIDLGDLKKALDNYHAKEGKYPATNGLEQTQSSQTLLTALVPTYITGLPVDPLRSTYWYEYSSDGTTYFLRSVAEDKANSQAKPGKVYSYFELTN